MITLGNIYNRIGDVWQWFRSLGLMLREGLTKLTGSSLAFFGSAVAVGKAGYDALAGYINEFMASLDSLHADTLSADWSGMRFITFANCLFPIDETISAIIIVFEFWVFCLLFRMNWHFRRQIRWGR